MSDTVERPYFPKRAIVTAGMPYGNKGLHFGHIAGVFVPADCYARFLRDRIGNDNVMFVSGTDCYGSPIDEGYRKLVAEGFPGAIEDYVRANHDAQKAALDAYDISLDIYEGSGLGSCKDVHAKMTDIFIRRLYENGFLEKRSTAQFYDTQAHMFLNGRQVVGRCPVQGCKSEKGYADECDLGHQYLPEDLIAPKSTVTGQTPEMRDVTNWYFKLPDFRELLSEVVDDFEAKDNVRDIVPQTIREFLYAPVIYIKSELLPNYEGCKDRLPEHIYHEAEAGKTSFSLEFANLDVRDEARGVLCEAGIRFRTGKALVPFRLTGNVNWGVPAPVLDGEEQHTVWCWPESLWAPISFSIACLLRKGHKWDEWKDWWCSDDADVFQFIGQDNIYFYGVAQPAMWSATQTGHEPHPEAAPGELKQTTLVANHHVLFMGKKASSSGAVKPPMAIDLLDHYTAEQLRAHFLALGLGLKSVSFAPKAYDSEAAPKAADPVLKEGTLLTNVFNRIARSCFYAAQNASAALGGSGEKDEDGNPVESWMPAGAPSEDVRAEAEETILAYERLMYKVELHSVMALMEDYIRSVSKRYNDTKPALDAAYAEGAKPTAEQLEVARQTLVDDFYALRVCTVLMHPIAPVGCEKIQMQMGFARSFFSWNHIFEGNESFFPESERVLGRHAMEVLKPRVDFFEKHPSQYEK